MSNGIALRRVMRDGVFSFHGKKYEVEIPGFAGKYVLVHYDSDSGEVQKIEANGIVEISVHLRRISNEYCCRREI